MHATNAIRAFVVESSDFKYGFGPRNALQGSWDLMQRWMEQKSGAKINFDPTLHFITGPWTFEEMKANTNQPALVFDWWNTAGFPVSRWPVRGTAALESGDTFLVMVVGAGGFAGGVSAGDSAEAVGWGFVGDAVLGPILAKHGWPELNTALQFFEPDAWQVQYRTAFGTPMHELGHAAFKLDHGEMSVTEDVPVSGLPANVMVWHGSVDPTDFSKSGFLVEHRELIQTSKYALSREELEESGETHMATVSFYNPNPVSVYGRLSIEIGDYEAGAFNAVATSSIAKMQADPGSAQTPTRSTDGALSIRFPQGKGYLGKGVFMYGATDEPDALVAGDVPQGWEQFSFDLDMAAYA